MTSSTTLLSNRQALLRPAFHRNENAFRAQNSGIVQAPPRCQARLATDRSAFAHSHSRSGCRRGPEPVAAVKKAPASPSADYFKTDDRPVILFDGVCNLCNGAVNFLLDWDKKGQYRLAALQSKAGSELLKQAGREPGDLSSVVLVEPGHAYAKSEAVLRIGRRLNTPFYVLGSLGLPIPSFLRDAAYDLVATTRYQVFGKTESCRMCDPTFRERFIDT